MAQPPAYTPSEDFSNDELNNVGGRSTILTAALDGELTGIATSINAIRDNLFLLQRDDGELRDGVVKLPSLSQEVLNLIVTEGDAVPRGPWVTATLYGVKNIVSQSGSTYMAVVQHTSGVFATDLAAGKWLLIANPAQTAATTPFTPAGAIAATNVQAAIVECDTENRALSTAASAAVSTLISDLASSANAAKGAALIGMGSLPGTVYAGGAGKAIQDLQRAAFLSVDQFGTVGTADDTAVFNLALAAATAAKCVLLVPTGTYTLTPITLPSNIVIFMEPGAILLAKTGYTALQCLLNIENASNVTIYGNGARVQMLKAEYVSGEFRHGVMILNSSDVRIYDLTSMDTGGDCFYIGRNGGAGTHCKRVSLIGCQGINGRRQGLSIVSGDTINVVDCTFRDTTGTPPAYGVDVEPNDSLDVCRNINITNLKTSGNSGGGLIIVLQFLAATAANDVSITVNGWTSDGDGSNSPGDAPAGLRVSGTGGGAWGFKITGFIKISNFLIRGSKSSGAWVTYWQANKTPLLQIQDGAIIDVASASPANAEDQCGIVIWGYNMGAQDFGNVEISRVRVLDTRGSPATYSPVYIFKTTGLTGVGQGRNIRLLDVMGEGFTPTSGRGHLLAIVDIDQSSVRYTLEQTVTDMPDDSTRTRGYAGYTIISTSARVNTLPKASLNRGLSYRCLNTTEGQAFQVRPTTGDLLDYCDSNINTDLVLSRYGAYVEYIATDGNFYRATNITDYAKRIGPQQASQLTGPRLVCWVTAMPTSGLWGAGTWALQVAPATGATPGWVRLTTGSGNVLNTDWRAMPVL